LASAQLAPATAPAPAALSPQRRGQVAAPAHDDEEHEDDEEQAKDPIPAIVIDIEVVDSVRLVIASLRI